jgi:hypothetical protein
MDLFDCGRDATERGVQVGAERRDRDDDGNGNPGGDQAIFDGRGACFVREKPSEYFTHVQPSIAQLSLPILEINATYCI